jgi:hypothetical protein
MLLNKLILSHCIQQKYKYRHNSDIIFTMLYRYFDNRPIVACLLKARIMKPAETAVAREWLYKYVL